MRLSIRHRIAYRFAEPVRNVTRILRLTPRSHEGQHVVGWQIDIDIDCVLKAGEDGFGNLTHGFTAKGPCEALSIAVTGEIDNFDAAGVVRGSAERMPTELYLRDTPLTLADGALRAFARQAVEGSASRLDLLHGLLGAVHAAVRFDADRPDAASGSDAFAAGAGSSRDLAHIYTACARHLGIPARVASGYYVREDARTGFGHSWCEAFVEGLGWTGFDPAHDVCPQERHIRLASALDALGSAPVRGVGAETVKEDLDIHAPFQAERSRGQSQSQGPGWQRQSQG